MYKPSDLFIGLLDFLAVLLPGIVLVFWSLPIFNAIQDQVLTIPESPQAQSLFFFAAALFLGNVAYGIGSALEEGWGSVRHVLRSRAREGALPESVAGSAARSGAGQRARDAELAAEVLNQLGHPSWPGYPSKTYCTIVVMGENEGVAGDIARLYALSRFFRTFSGVFLVILLAGGSPSLRFFAAWFTRLQGFLVVLTLLGASFAAYLIYRRIHERRLYRAVVALLTPKIVAVPPQER